MIRKDFFLRPGTVWKFRLSGATKNSSSIWHDVGRKGFVAQIQTVEGLAHLTLPSEGGKFNLSSSLKYPRVSLRSSPHDA